MKIIYSILCWFGFHKFNDEKWEDFWDEYWDEQTGDEHCESGKENFCLRCNKHIKQYN